jgi:uncharacterized protein YegP (UPF0339 family)
VLLIEILSSTVPHPDTSTQVWVETFALRRRFLAASDESRSRAIADSDERYEKKVATNGKHFFNLKAANHQVIGTGQMYATAQSCDTGIASVKSNGTTKTVKDNT